MSICQEGSSIEETMYTKNNGMCLGTQGEETEVHEQRNQMWYVEILVTVQE